MVERTLRTGLSWHEVLVVFWLLLAAWLLAVGAFAVVVVGDGLVHDEVLECELGSGGSTTGTVEWSWEQLGDVCRWDVDRVGPVENGPGLIRWVMLAGLAVWGVTVLFLGSLLFDLTDRARARTDRRMLRQLSGR